jgi:hypothetical protein
MPHPPEVAELILRALLPLDMRETVSGDLLEEYRESRVPAVGEFRADLWYWRQVGGMWLRAYWWLVVSVVLLLVVSDMFNTFRAPSGASYLDGLPRLVDAVISPLVGVVGLLGLATAYGSWRTQRWQGGFVAALGSLDRVVVHGGLGERDVPLVAQVQQANPYWVQRGTGTPITARRKRRSPLDVLGQRRRLSSPASSCSSRRFFGGIGAWSVRSRSAGGSSRATNHQPCCSPRRGGLS